jgi:hypothetical protein
MASSPNLLESRRARFGPTGNPLDLLTQPQLPDAEGIGNCRIFGICRRSLIMGQLGFGRDRACQAAPSFMYGDGESSIAKCSGMLHKEGRVLEQCPMARFWIDDELRIRNVLPQDKGVHGR